jgi:hypothetical protein
VIRSSRAFATIVAFAITGYLAFAAAILDDRASSAADDALVTLLTVLMGATGIVALSLLLRGLALSERGATQEDSTEA